MGEDGSALSQETLAKIRQQSRDREAREEEIRQAEVEVTSLESAPCKTETRLAMSNGDTHEMAIPDDLKADYRTLAEPYVEPATLQWAIERDKNMQKFAHKLIERIAQLTQELNALKERYAFYENQRLCLGYADSRSCDGDLEGTKHEEWCPARVKDLQQLRPYLYDEHRSERS